MKKLLALIGFALWLMLPAAAFAAPEPAPTPGIGRISWAVSCAGNMPQALAVILLLIAALLLITVIRYNKLRKKGGKKK